MTTAVRRASAEEIFPLRHAVLRPGRPVTASVYAQDEAAVHLGAWDEGLLVGCATVFPDPWPGPDPAADAGAWRLRGMAVEPTRQRTGVGRLVLTAAVRAAREAGAPLLWANARTAALPFYAAAGWVVAGAEFITPDTGLPHRPIVLPNSGETPSGVAPPP
ncbi:MAG TPA: GNAT family N-acetyltransferase [Mycobacteriales bacterium]|nr:GNAT family N-acetyltransferase [Mycobacteriales bacterium]